MFRQHCEVMVINTDDSLRARHPHWHHIAKEGYFTDQWNAALEQFDADVFLQIQADIPSGLRCGVSPGYLIA